MLLPDERVGPYVRALAAAVDSLAPDDAWVPLRAALDHLHALDPAVSGPMLLPGEVSPLSGMPAYGWLQRASAEAELARSAGDEPDDARLTGIRAVDPGLADRLLGRRELHRHLRGALLLATTAIDGAARRLDPTTDLHLRYDRLAPDGRWERIRFDLRTDRRAVPDGVTLDGNGRVAVHEALQHLLTRHYATPLLALRQQLQDATGAEVRSLSRALVGPFWFAGGALPAGVPSVLGTGLALHATREVVGVEVRASGHRDPWYPAPLGEPVPEGHGLFRERRVAVSAPLVVAARAWFEAAGLPPAVVPIGAPRPRRL